MASIEENLREQIAEGPQASPQDPVEVVEAAREDAWLRALLALSDDIGLQAAWARHVSATGEAGGETDAAGRVAWVSAEIEEVDERVDATLEEEGEDDNGAGAAEVLDALARAGVPWAHPSLAARLDAEDDAIRRAAALTMARSEPEELRPWISAGEVVEDVVDVLRAGALAGAEELWDLFLVWRMRLEDLEEDEDGEEGADSGPAAALDAVDGVAATLDPTLYARGVLAGDYGIGWLERPVSVGDFLCVYGATDWLEPLGVLAGAAGATHGMGAFGLAAGLAASAADGVGVEAPEDEEIEALMELVTTDPSEAGTDEAGGEPEWQSTAAELGFGFQMALGDGGFELLLCQAAAHERLVSWGIHSPGLPGLPLSATGEQDVDQESVYWLIGEIAGADKKLGDEAVVVAVRTLCDARTWLRRDREAFQSVCAQMVDMFEGSQSTAIAIARDRLRMELDAEFRANRLEDAESGASLQTALVVGVDAEAPEGTIERLETAAAEDEGLLGMECARLLAEIGTDPALQALGRLWVQEAPVYRAEYMRQLLEEALRFSPPSEGGD